MDKPYMEKEIAIMEGAIALLRSGIHPYQLKVSDIADAAEIGKGTVYQYFSTKEEVIGRSVLYNLEKETNAMLETLTTTSGFRHRLDLVLDQIQRNLRDPLSPFHVLSSAKEYGAIIKKCMPGDGSFAHEMDRFHQVVDLVVQEGLKEGIVDAQDDRMYCQTVIKSALFAWGHNLIRLAVEGNEDVLSDRSSIYKMVERAFKI
ncbi:TetR/AcrR family transcriptional regulator [Alkalibacter rhizosphaerae]|uniref:TetR/AcrR family transcriptional regulator n=1 Tax=Alkalibacter rhizosphaerae TaxID=2815577 RepID=A0A974XE02_9FIRM|nr:TetR/AcrR family transcriptional regulator [Alkalibacter rhizosphaerae]QSX07991.1 TetR/AcrR family transcriptional regulator [Alkalibacter rhizosphaerae]